MKAGRAYILGVLVQFLILLLALGGGYDDPADLEAVAVAISVDSALPQTIFRACHAVYSQGGRRAGEGRRGQGQAQSSDSSIYGHAEVVPNSKSFHGGALQPDASSAQGRVEQDPWDSNPAGTP